LIQASEAVEYHEHFETTLERFNQWITDAEYRLDKHNSSNEIKSDHAVEERYRSVEVQFI
jgi:hypothetical protein